MNFKGIAIITLSVIFCAVSSFSIFAGAEDSAVDRMTIALPVADMNWVEEPWGGRTALVWGDPKTGPSGFMIDHPVGYKMAPNMTIAHTANMRAVIVTGWMKVWKEGQSADELPKLTPGSCFFKPGGVDHYELHSPDEPTLVYVEYDKPRDAIIKADGKIVRKGPPM